MLAHHEPFTTDTAKMHLRIDTDQPVDQCLHDLLIQARALEQAQANALLDGLGVRRDP